MTSGSTPDPSTLVEVYASEMDFDRGDLLDDREHMAPAAFAALRAVLDAHPERKFDTWSACDGCTDGAHLVVWPCETVQAIVAALEAA